ncbi:unnamed protein product, partial [Anisakis simplex]|uniref:POP4 domain-containing protein n=1 Tax=Anisakis simplex TaxID=6269 RepID=A0A0M3JGC6_ANISI
VKPAHSPDSSCGPSTRPKRRDGSNAEDSIADCSTVVADAQSRSLLQSGMSELERLLRAKASASVNSNRTPVYYRVLEFLSCGSIEAATNGQLLCSNKIGYLLVRVELPILGNLEVPRSNGGGREISLSCSCYFVIERHCNGVLQLGYVNTVS